MQEPEHPTAAPAAVIVLDAALHLREVNDAASTLFGYDRDELLTFTAERVLAFDDAWLQASYAALQADGTWYGDVAMRHKDGRILHTTAAATYRTHPVGREVVVTFHPYAR